MYSLVCDRVGISFDVVSNILNDIMNHAKKDELTDMVDECIATDNSDYNKHI